MPLFRSICISLLCLPLPLYVISVPGIPINVYELIASISGVGYLSTIWRNIVSLVIQFVRQFWILLLFIPLAVIGVIVSDEIIASLGRLKSYILLPFGVSFVIFIHIRKYSARLPLTMLSLSGAVIGLWAFTELMVNVWFGEWIRPNTIYDWNASGNLTHGGFANFIGLFITPMWPVALGGIWYTTSRWGRRLYIFMAAAITAGIFASQSYAAIGVWGVSTLIFSWWMIRIYLRQSARKFVGVAGALILIVLGFGVTQVQTAKFTQLWDMSERNSITSRIQIWHASAMIISEHPITGLGLADFQAAYEDTVPHLYFPPHEWLVPEPHNMYLANWIHLGLGGFVLGIVILGHVVDKGRRMWKTGNVMGISVWGALLSIHIYGLMDTTLWKNDLAVVFMVLYVWIMTIHPVHKPANI